MDATSAGRGWMRSVTFKVLATLIACVLVSSRTVKADEQAVGGGVGSVTAPPASGKKGGQSGVAAFSLGKLLNVRYTETEGVNPNLQSLDIYYPVGEVEGIGQEPAAPLHPVVIMVHGGAWCIGDKANPGVAAVKSRYFVSEGYVFVSVNYRLSPAARHPDHVRDVAAAVAWVHTNIARYGGDPERVFLMGHSAGAHLAALVATDERHLASYRKELGIIKGVVLLDNPVFDLPGLLGRLDDRGQKLATEFLAMLEGAFGPIREVWHDASPRTHVSSGKAIPPFLIFASNRLFGTGALADEFVAALREAGGAGRPVEVFYKNHESLNRDIGKPGDEPTRLIMEFLADPAGAVGE